MPKSQSLTVIIPTLNEEHMIGCLLQQLTTQSRRPDEIIVVDGKSKDKTTRVIKTYKQVKLLVCAPHVARQRNYGANRASGNLLCFMDADSSIDRDFIKKSLQEIADRSLSIACPMYYPPDEARGMVRGFFGILRWLFFRAEKYSPAGGGNCIFISKSLFEYVNGFPDIAAYEDAELINKAGKIGQFGILKTKLVVSDRRFKKYGVARTIGLYSLLGILFACNMYKLARKIPYKFGSYEAK